jgi:hypothetical protein
VFRQRRFGGGGGSDAGFAAETDVFGRGANEDVEDARLDAEVVDLDVVEGEAADRELEGDGLRFTGLEVNAFEGVQALDGLVDGAGALMGVELCRYSLTCRTNSLI